MKHFALLLASLSSTLVACHPTMPNIVFILMDDIGWNDVSFNGAQVPTPNIDSLRDESIFLTKHYIHLMCSPSRSQIITGRYSMYLGFGKMMPWDYTELGGIPVGQPTVANWLKTAGKYATYAVGKWHMGYAYQGLLPGSKGFDHFYGFYQGAIHYDNLKYIDIKFGDSNHYDFWEDGREKRFENTEKAINTMRLYKEKIIRDINDEQRNEDSPFYMYLALQTIHGPLNEVHEKKEDCLSILGDDETMARHKYCQNLLLTDDVIGEIVDELKSSGNWDNTLIVFTSDNGADVSNKGCNFPLRGTKGTLFDGNIRTLALVGGGAIPESQHGSTRDVLFSSLDWTPTLLDFAGILPMIAEADQMWDGVSQKDMILKGDSEKVRDHIVLNVGKRDYSSASIVFEKEGTLYKYVSENEDIDSWAYKRDDGWCVPDTENKWAVVLDTEVSLSAHVENQYLFDLDNDVSEKTNLLQLESQDELIEYATALLNPVAHHPLFSEYLNFLWVRMPAGDPALLGDGSFVSPFLTELEYFKHLSRGFTSIEEDYESARDEAKQNHEKFTDKLSYGKALKGLYMQKWKPPQFLEFSEVGGSNVFLWYVYVIIAVVVLAFAVIVGVSVMRWRKYRSIYKDGYESVDTTDAEEVGSVTVDKEVDETTAIRV